MALKRSTALRNTHLGTKPLNGAFKDYILTLFGGTIPSSADDAAGTALARITLDSSTYSSPVAQISTLTITRANSGTHYVTIEGVKFTYVAGAASVATDDVADSLVAMINAATGVAAITLTNGTMKMSQGTSEFYRLEGLVTAAKASSTSVTLTSSAGVSFAVTASGATGGDTSVALTQEATPGLLFEAYSGISSGILEKNSGQTWSGVGLVAGTATYWRIHSTGDTNASDTSTYVRLQGSVGTANADVTATSTAIAVSVPVTLDTFSITIPENA